MEKVNSSVCIRCGGPLPAGRKAWCCTCRPLRRRAELRKPPKKEPPKYTLAEWQAMAEAYDMSYGQYHLYVSMGWMRRPKSTPSSGRREANMRKKRNKMPRCEWLTVGRPKEANLLRHIYLSTPEPVCQGGGGKNG